MGKGMYASYAATKQYSIQTYDYLSQIWDINTSASLLEKTYEIALLKNANVKFSINDVVFAVKNKKGQLYWLEKGNESVGLKHIVLRHKNDFEKAYGVKEKDIPGFIKNLLLSGDEIAERTRMKNGKVTIQQNYRYNGKYYTLNAVGTNGFIVSCYPVSMEG